MKISEILGAARAELEEAQQWARLYDEGQRVAEVPARNGQPGREIDVAKEAARLARASRATTEDALARLTIEGGR